jgi:hypothetical protein
MRSLKPFAAVSLVTLSRRELRRAMWPSAFITASLKTTKYTYTSFRILRQVHLNVTEKYQENGDIC